MPDFLTLQESGKKFLKFHLFFKYMYNVYLTSSKIIYKHISINAHDSHLKLSCIKCISPCWWLLLFCFIFLQKLSPIPGREQEQGKISFFLSCVKCICPFFSQNVWRTRTRPPAEFCTSFTQVTYTVFKFWLNLNQNK